MKFPKRMLHMVLILLTLIGCLCVTAFAEGTTMYGIGFVQADNLCLRKEPATTAAVAAAAKERECVVVIAQEGDWYKVIYNLKEGYMHKDFLSVRTAENAELGYGKVLGAQVNLRSGPAVTYPLVGTAIGGDKCYILGLNSGWYKVLYKDSISYIRSDYLELTEFPYENRDSVPSPKYYRGGNAIGVLPAAAPAGIPVPAAEPTAAPKVTGAQILAEARNYLGTRYVYGGASPSGFDCSGYVYYVLKVLGFSPARTPADQFGMGTPVDKGSMQPGDIVFFAGTAASSISHVGIYAGNGMFVHAPNSYSVVSYSDLTSGYWADHFCAARRVAN